MGKRAGVRQTGRSAAIHDKSQIQRSNCAAHYTAVRYQRIVRGQIAQDIHTIPNVRHSGKIVAEDVSAKINVPELHINPLKYDAKGYRPQVPIVPQTAKEEFHNVVITSVGSSSLLSMKRAGNLWIAAWLQPTMKRVIDSRRDE